MIHVAQPQADTTTDDAPYPRPSGITPLQACAIYGLPLRYVWRHYVWGSAWPKQERIGRADVWGVWYADPRAARERFGSSPLTEERVLRTTAAQSAMAEAASLRAILGGRAGG